MASEPLTDMARVKELEKVIQNKEQFVDECATTLKEAKAALAQAVMDLRLAIREIESGQLALPLEAKQPGVIHEAGEATGLIQRCVRCGTILTDYRNAVSSDPDWKAVWWSGTVTVYPGNPEQYVAGTGADGTMCEKYSEED